MSIDFSNNRYGSKITIVSERDTARELAVGTYQSLSEIIERSKTMNWFFHPSHLLDLFLWAVLVFLPTVYVIHSADSNSACSRTVSVAFSCLSGG